MPFDWGLVGKVSAAVLLLGLTVAAYTFLVWSPYRKDLASIELIRQRFAYVDDEKEARQLFEILCGRRPDPTTNRKLPPHPGYADSSFSRFWSKRAELLESLAAGEQEPDQRLLRLALAGIKRDLKIPPDVIKAFNRRYANAVTVLRGHRGSPTAVAFSSDKGTVVTGGADGVIKLWRTGATWWPGLEYVREINFQSSGTPLYKPNMLHLQDVPGRQLLTAVSDVGLVMVWAIEQAPGASPGVLLSHYTGAGRGHIRVGALEPYTPRAALADPKGTWLLITGGALEHVPLEAGKAVSRELPRGQDAAWNADFLAGPDARFATTGGRGVAPLWDERLAPAGSLNLGRSHRNAKVTALQFSPDGKWFLAGTDVGDTVLGEVASLGPVSELPQQEGPIALARFCCVTPASCWPKDLHEALLLTAVQDRGSATVRLWKIPLPPTGAPSRPFREKTFPGGTFATSTDCALLATIGGAVDNLEIDGVVVREPWTTAKPSDDARAVLMDWQRILRKRIDDTGKVEDLVDPESLRRVERVQVAGCTIIPEP
jgi:WD40 repeat protein